MTDDHKAALAHGRPERRVVREYLESIKANKPPRGRRRTVASIGQRLAVVDAQLIDGDPLTELTMVQERKGLQAELVTQSAGPDQKAADDAFVEVANAYAKRHGISYSIWRDVGVDASVLKRAGITR